MDGVDTVHLGEDIQCRDKKSLNPSWPEAPLEDSVPRFSIAGHRLWEEVVWAGTQWLHIYTI
jgi:hypothetical protein